MRPLRSASRFWRAAVGGGPPPTARPVTAVLGLALGVATGAPEAGEPSRIPGCPATPNCVSSASRTDGHSVRPFAFDGSPDAAWNRLKQAVQMEPGLVVVGEDPAERYLHLEATSRVLHFVDDVEFQLVPEARVIEVRSASRVGYWDLGVNRRRIERLREHFAGLGEPR